MKTVGLSVNFQKLSLKKSNFFLQNPGFSLRNTGIRASENSPGTRDIEFKLFPSVQPCINAPLPKYPAPHLRKGFVSLTSPPLYAHTVCSPRRCFFIKKEVFYGFASGFQLPLALRFFSFEAHRPVCTNRSKKNESHPRVSRKKRVSLLP